MKNNFAILAFLVVIIATAATLYIEFDPFADMNRDPADEVYKWRYKMTVVVDTPEGEKSGSAVREVTAKIKLRNKLRKHPPVEKSVRGEAVVVDLGDRGVLFALMDVNEYQQTLSAFPYMTKGGLTRVGLQHFDNLPVGTRTVIDPKTYPGYPRMVTFTNMNDPKTVVSLMKWQPSDKYPITYTLEEDRFEEYFGEGVRLKEVSIEITEESFQWDVKKHIPWITKYHNKLFDGKQVHTIYTDFPFANSLGAGAFTTYKEKINE